MYTALYSDFDNVMLHYITFLPHKYILCANQGLVADQIGEKEDNSKPNRKGAENEKKMCTFLFASL